MTGEMWLALIGVVFGSAGLFALIQFLISRHDKKHDRLQEIEKQLNKTEADSVRMQLLFLVTQMPEEHQEIMTVGEHYFSDLKKNWYMTSLFQKWCDKEHLEVPIWVNHGGKE
jgi:hypothetical protein